MRKGRFTVRSYQGFPRRRRGNPCHYRSDTFSAGASSTERGSCSTSAGARPPPSPPARSARLGTAAHREGGSRARRGCRARRVVSGPAVARASPGAPEPRENRLPKAARGAARPPCAPAPRAPARGPGADGATWDGIPRSHHGSPPWLISVGPPPHHYGGPARPIVLNGWITSRISLSMRWRIFVQAPLPPPPASLAASRRRKSTRSQALHRCASG
jgi:hypothetical protein